MNDNKIVQWIGLVLSIVAVILSAVSLSQIHSVIGLVGGNSQSALGSGTPNRIPHGYWDTSDGYSVDGIPVIDGSGNIVTYGSIQASSTVTQGGGIRATSTSVSTTLLATDFDTENIVLITPNAAGVVETLPASSTLTSMIPYAGMCRTIYFGNASTTGGAAPWNNMFTMASSTGIFLHVMGTSTPNTGIQMYGGAQRTLMRTDWCRRTDSDIDVTAIQQQTQ